MCDARPCAFDDGRALLPTRDHDPSDDLSPRHETFCKAETHRTFRLAASPVAGHKWRESRKTGAQARFVNDLKAMLIRPPLVEAGLARPAARLLASGTKGSSASNQQGIGEEWRWHHIPRKATCAK